jgi:hypothetical protein
VKSATVDPLKLSALLQELALKLTDRYVTADGSKVNYNALRGSAEFAGKYGRTLMQLHIAPHPFHEYNVYVL